MKNSIPLVLIFVVLFNFAACSRVETDTPSNGDIDAPDSTELSETKLVFGASFHSTYHEFLLI